MKGTLRIHCALREQVCFATAQGLRWAGAAVDILERLDIGDEEMMLKKLAVGIEPLAKLNTIDLLQFGCEAQSVVFWRMLYRGSEDGSSAVHLHMVASEGDVAWFVVLRRELLVSWRAFSAVVRSLSCLVFILVSSSVSIILRCCWYVVVTHFVRSAGPAQDALQWNGSAVGDAGVAAG